MNNKVFLSSSCLKCTVLSAINNEEKGKTFFSYLSFIGDVRVNVGVGGAFELSFIGHERLISPEWEVAGEVG